MKYELVIWFTKDDAWDCDSFELSSLQECADHFERNYPYYGVRQNVYINGKRIENKNCKLIDSDGEVFSTNPEYHNIFGKGAI